MRTSDLAAYGLSPDDIKAEAEKGIPVWPGNEQAAGLFRDLRTQWRFTNGSRVGLDYNVLYAKFDRKGLSPDRCERLEADVRVMEYAALTVFAERRERERRKQQ